MPEPATSDYEGGTSASYDLAVSKHCRANKPTMARNINWYINLNDCSMGLLLKIAG